MVLIRPTQGLSGFDFNPGISFSTALKEYRLYAEQHPGLALGLLPPRDPKAGPITFNPRPACLTATRASPRPRRALPRRFMYAKGAENASAW